MARTVRRVPLEHRHVAIKYRVVMPWMVLELLLISAKAAASAGRRRSGDGSGRGSARRVRRVRAAGRRVWREQGTVDDVHVA